MKKILSILLILAGMMTFVSLNAQSINGVPISKLDSDYIEISCTSKFFSTKVTVSVDFGQKTKLFGNLSKSMKIIDANNKAVEFNSSIDALNFFKENGYKFVAAYAISTGKQNVYHYLMEKEK